ncbi:MAG: hypothetical protein ACYC8V_10840 [Caulobacteraceae bacterium]
MSAPAHLEESDRLAEPIVQWQPKTRAAPGDTSLVSRSGAVLIGAMAGGVLAFGALAIGALAVGTLLIGRLAVGRVQLKDVEIDNLVVRRGLR